VRKKIGINGFGRIGRQVIKAINERHRDKLQVVAVNDLVDAKTNAHLMKYDSTYGPYKGSVEVKDGKIVVDGDAISITAEKEPGLIPWKAHGVDIVIESTGRFTDATKARAHVDQGGAKKCVISAPGKNEDLTIVLGVNDELYDAKKHVVVSNASCTTNGLAPIAKVLNDTWGIAKGLLTTVHAYTNTQNLLDLAKPDLRDARAAAQNIVPSETGAAKAVGLVIPELKGKFGGMAFRVPTPTVSVTCVLNKAATKESIREAMLAAANGRMKGVLRVTDEPLVSCDLRGDAHSSIFSALDTLVMDELVKVVAWYDNEWGYSCRVLDLMLAMAKKEGLTK
jgi:glyceraldehyde 3-phosphate dehydrogenase